MTLARFNADRYHFFIKSAISHHRTQAQANYYNSTFTRDKSESKSSSFSCIHQQNASSQRKNNDKSSGDLKQIYLLCKLNS